MSTVPIPSIACIGIIGKHSNPLHIALFPPHISHPAAHLEFSFLLHAALDIFELRSRDRNRVDQDLGLLQAVDERLSIWGWETGTGTRLAIVLDMWGREGMESVGRGVGEGELRSAFRALQTAYVHLLQNPFYVPDEHLPGKAGPIKSRKFAAEVERIGMKWRPGLKEV